MGCVLGSRADRREKQPARPGPSARADQSMQSMRPAAGNVNSSSATNRGFSRRKQGLSRGPKGSKRSIREQRGRTGWLREEEWSEWVFQAIDQRPETLKKTSDLRLAREKEGRDGKSHAKKKRDGKIRNSRSHRRESSSMIRVEFEIGVPDVQRRSVSVCW